MIILAISHELSNVFSSEFLVMSLSLLKFYKRHNFRFEVTERSMVDYALLHYLNNSQALTAAVSD